MKKIRIRNALVVLLAVVLAMATMLSLAACEKEPEETTSVSAFHSGKGWTPLADPVSWEDINSFPIKTPDMAIEDARKLCVDFFRYSKTAVWIPNDNYDFYHDWGNTRQDTLVSGNTYGGLPYISMASGSIYRLMDYVDPKTGVVDMAKAGAQPKFFGNQCSFAAYWGWGRVINSPDYNFTENMVLKSGFIPMGECTYQDVLVGLSAGYGTDEILAENGKDVIYDAYSQLKAGDGIVNFTDAGHVVMVASDAHVEYAADGSIDPDASYITAIEQGQTWATTTNEAGDTYTHQKNVDTKKTFTTMFDNAYMPFTYAEWLGTDPIEETEITFSHSGETISFDELFKSGVTCNYGLSDIYAVFHDKKGNEVLKIASRAHEGGIKELKFFKMGDAVTIWGDMDSLDPKNGYTVDIIAQIATGERPTLWSGKLA